MLPFGAGTRHCPGMGLGLVHARLLLAALVRAFQWGVLAAGGGCAPVDLIEVDGFVKHMKTPLKAEKVKFAPKGTLSAAWTTRFTLRFVHSVHRNRACAFGEKKPPSLKACIVPCT